MNPFLITGMGRSGTKFLATVLDKSAITTVKHEDPEDGQYLLPNAVPPIERFISYYGEVNSLLRVVAPELAKNGVSIMLLLRDPRYVVRSVLQARKWKRRNLESAILLTKEGFEQVLRLKEDKKLIDRVFRFEDLIILRKRAVWELLFHATNIQDIEYDTIDFGTKINSNGPKFPISKPNRWTIEEKELFDKHLGEITRKLGYG